MGIGRECAVATGVFRFVNVTPDLCQVGKRVIPFDITQVLSAEFSGYSVKVMARGVKCLMADSVVAGTLGHLGKGILSSVGQGMGHTKILHGDPKVLVNSKEFARHLDPCEMNRSA